MSVEVIIYSIVGVALALAIPLGIRRYRRAGLGVICRDCHYDLAGLDPKVTPACPECGCEFERRGVTSLPDYRNAPAVRDVKSNSPTRAALSIIIWCAPFVVIPLAFALPPIAFVHTERHVMTFGPTPASTGVLTLEWSGTFRAGDRETVTHPNLGEVTDYLTTSLVAKSSKPGAPELELTGGRGNPGIVREWLLKVDPTLSGQTLDDAANLMASQTPSGFSPAFWHFANQPSPQASPPSVMPTGLQTWRNGVRSAFPGTTGGSAWTTLREALGRPSLKYSDWRHAFNAFVLLLVAALPFVWVPIARWNFRRTHRRWLAGELPREAAILRA